MEIGILIRRRAFMFLSILLPMFGYSQNKDEVWTDYNYNYILNSKVSIFGDVGYRFAENNIILFRPSVKYTFADNFMIMGGLGNFYSSSSDLGIKAYEIRPWQGARVVWPQKSTFFSLKHYVRFEEQFVTNLLSKDGFEGRLRFRYQIGTELDIWDNASGTFGISIPLEYEIFHSFVQSDYFMERDRIIAGILFEFGRGYKLEVNYTMQRAGEGFADLSPDIGIYRIRIKHTIFNTD